MLILETSWHETLPDIFWQSFTSAMCLHVRWICTFNEGGVLLCDMIMWLLCDVVMWLLCDVIMWLLCDVVMWLLCDVVMWLLCDIVMWLLCDVIMWLLCDSHVTTVWHGHVTTVWCDHVTTMSNNTCCTPVMWPIGVVLSHPHTFHCYSSSELDKRVHKAHPRLSSIVVTRVLCTLLAGY